MKTPPLLGRILIVGAMALLLLLPIALIQGKIAERHARAESVVARFAQESSGPQAVAGPFLAFTCQESHSEQGVTSRNGKSEVVTVERPWTCPTLYLAPRVLRVKGEVPVEVRRRGIYRVHAWQAVLELEAEFVWPEAAARSGINIRAWRRAVLSTAVRDARGIKRVEPAGTLVRDAIADGEPAFAIHDEVGAWSDRKPGDLVTFRFRLELAGTSRLDLAPVGDDSEIQLASNWPHPSFGGAWLPEKRAVDPTGFSAVWRTSHLATGGLAFWEKALRGGKLTDTVLVAGVTFFDPVNVYALSHRATEYAFLIVLFTFAGIALLEAVAGVRVHPVQYALVGSALAVFFLLLIALSEHLAFDAAYLAAAGACLALLVAYLRPTLGTAPRTAAFAALGASLYGALFLLLKSEEHALLLGSLMVFALLALAMLTTRRVDWDALSERMRSAVRTSPVGPV